MKKILVLSLLLLTVKICYSQTYSTEPKVTYAFNKDINPISPNSASLGEYVVQPVSYYTGIPEISIPLWEVNLKDFSLPIYISYHAGGIKVEEAASNVGLGWALNAGGVISRSVKDIPDDESPQFCDTKWIYLSTGPGDYAPPISDFSKCGYGRLWAFDAPANNHFNGINSFDVNLSDYDGTKGINFLKNFYGVTTNNQTKPDLYLLPVIDKEPDIFFFNFGNFKGRFIIDSENDNKCRLIPYQDIEIEFSTDERKKINQFIITDNNGVIYTFDAVEITQTYTVGNIDHSSEDAFVIIGNELRVKHYEGDHVEKKYITTWYLSKIETPMKEVINFTYIDDIFRIDSRGPQNTTTGNWGSGAPNAALYYNPNEEGIYYNNLKTNYSIINGKRISSIENDNFSVKFNATYERSDLAKHDSHKTYAINEIIVSNKIGSSTRIKKFVLTYDYFLSDTREPINYTSRHETRITIPDSMAYYRRLRLTELQEFGTDDIKYKPYKFSYHDKDFTGNFYHSLPHRLSFQRDYWGYNNGIISNKTLIPKIFVYPTHFNEKDNRQFNLDKIYNHNGDEYLFLGAERRATIGVIYGLLTKIIHPTGGTTSFTYGSNDYNYEGMDENGGGARVQKIIKNPIDSDTDRRNAITIRYYYTKDINGNGTTSGDIISMPVFAIRNNNVRAYNVPNDDDEIAYNLWTTRYSNSQNQLDLTSGSYVGYRTVIESLESIEGNGKIVRKYSMPATWNAKNDKPKDQNGDCDSSIDGHCDGFYTSTIPKDIIISRNGTDLNISDYDLSQFPATHNSFPFADNPNYDWQRGHLLYEGIYSESGEKVKERYFEYSNYFPNNGSQPFKLYGYKLGAHYPLLKSGLEPNTYVFRVSKYEILTDVCKKLSKESTIVYDQGDQNNNISQLATFFYNSPDHSMVTKTSTSISNNKNHITNYFYPKDFSDNEYGSNVLNSKKINNVILRKESGINDSNIYKEERSFIAKDNIVVPNVESIFANGTDVSKKFIYEYDDEGNIIEVSIEGNTTIAYIWGYEGQYPVAKLVNASYSSIPTTTINEIKEMSNLDDDHCLGSSSCNENNLRTVLNTLRNLVSNSLITTYTYDPLIGITSETDPSGKTTYYKYDSFGRLQNIKDHQGNIVQQYEYHYQNQ